MQEKIETSEKPSHREKRTTELSKRIEQVMEDEGNSSFGRRCGIGEATLRSYLSGTTPSVEKLVAIADAANVSIEWLATGRGIKQRGSSIPMIPRAVSIPASVTNIDDINRLELSISSVEEALGSTYFSMPIQKRAKLVAAVYDLLEDTNQKSNIIKFIRIAA